jgi:thiol-disulfide isomerase/thioredoxin
VKSLKAKVFLLSLIILSAVQVLQAQKVKPLNSTDDIKSVFDGTKGKVMLLNFWATWCKPCVKEFPDLLKLQKNYKDLGFELVFISLDAPEELDSKLKPFLSKLGIDFTTYYSTFAKPEDLIDFVDKNWQGAIPSTYIYDKEGKLSKSFLGVKSYGEFEKEIKKLL